MIAALLLGTAGAEPDLVQEPDWVAVGLVLLLGGTFLLGNSLLFRHPRELVAERFGARGARFVAIREHIFQRLQIGVGFLYLLAGFGFELLGRLRPVAPGAERTFPVFWVVVLALATAALLAAGWAWSSRAFRRYVREQMQRAPADLESDPALAREIGELFGVESRPEDSIASFVERVRRAAGVSGERRAPRREIHVERVDEDEV